MLKPKTVEVNQQNIDQGVCENKESCAIALALRHTYLDEIDYVEVERFDSIKMSSSDDRWWQVNICEDDDFKVQSFIDNFDAGENVEPMSFKIDHIEEY
tara:strand:- start:336 stop:632 length:297 start_codon:yes stop_codon:yes gene_type:complete